MNVPTKVERIALQNTASIAGLLLNTEAAGAVANPTPPSPL